jgi:ribosomal protein S12 methylthiotransferase
VKEARELVARGTKELILVSQDTSRYGSSGPAAEGLSRLLEELAAIENLKWLRILYTHPAHLEKRVLQTMASSPTICPYLDIPLQHISDRVLKRMGRGVSRARIEALLDLARELVPGISLRTTLMVGFPGEGEAEFGELLEFVRWQRFDHLGVFVYSPEKGTPAARLASRIDRTTALLRRKKLMRTQKMIAAARLRKYRSATVPVLLDGPFPERSSRLMIGHTRFQAPEIDGLVVVEGEDLKIGDLIPVNVTSSSSYDLYGVADV